MRRTVIFSVFLILILSDLCFALEPPSKEEIQAYKQDGSFMERITRARELGNHRVSSNLAARAKHKLERMRLQLEGKTPSEIEIMAVPPAWKGMPATGTVKILVLLIDFSDYPASNTTASVESKIFGDGSGGSPYESLRNYYRRSSYNQLEIQGNLLGWYRPSYPRSSVPQNTTGRQNLIKEALNYYHGLGHDFAQYDNDGDGAIDYLVVIWTGPDNGWSGFWWGYMTDFTDSSYRLDGKRLSTYSWQWEARSPYTGTFNPKVVIHETGHALGLPDYYDYTPGPPYDGPRGGVGDLDMMDSDWGDHNCFSKFLLDWINPAAYGSGAHTITLNASGTTQDAIVVMPGATAGNEFGEFFMVQNRYRVGNDPSNYPSNGLLIWHVDSRLDSTGRDFQYDNSYTVHKLLRLMEADGLEEIETSSAQADAGDYYVAGRTLGPTTIPNSNRYAGTPTGLTVYDISPAGSSMSIAVSFSETGLVPSAPTLISPANGATGVSTNPSLTWNASSGATSYRLQVSTNSLFSTTAFAQSGIAGSSQAVNGLLHGTLYYWRVNATNAAGTSGWSTTWSFTTTASPPAAPTLVSPANGATGVSTNPALAWNTSSGAASYRVQVSTSSLFSTTVFDQSGITGISQAINSLLNNTLYYWRVNAANTAGTSGWSTTWSFTTIIPSPPAPTLVSPANGQSGISTNPLLSWNPSPGAASYRLQVSTSGSFSSLLFDLSPITSTSQGLSGLLNMATFYWRVNSTNGGGTSNWSGIWRFTTGGHPEIDISQDGVGIPDGAGIFDSGTAMVGGGTTATFTVENRGTAPLHLLGSPRIQITGINATDFEVLIQPADSVSVGGSTTFVIQFTPEATGIRTATVSIPNDDAAQTPYVFTITGTGTGQPFPFVDGFNSDKGWDGYRPGGWERKAAAAGGGEHGNPEPTADHSHTEDNFLLGFAIEGDVPDGLPEESITSPPIDCTGQDQVFLRFWRYLNVGSGDLARVYVSNDGANWSQVWENPGEVADTEWVKVAYDISPWAAHQDAVYIRFAMGLTDASQRFSGWNIDDLEVTSGYSISGFIRDKEGQPIEGVLVCFQDRDRMELKSCVYTDGSGFYIQYGFESYNKIAKNPVYVTSYDPGRRFSFSPKRKALKITTSDLERNFKATLR